MKSLNAKTHSWTMGAALSSRYAAAPLRFAPSGDSAAPIVPEPTTAERGPFRR